MSETSAPVTKKQKTDETAIAPLAEARMMTTSTGGTFGGISKETPVTIPPTITHGVQNTHTTICSYLDFFTIRNVDYRANNATLRLRMNSPGYDPCAFSGITTTGTGKGFSRDIKSCNNDTDISHKFPIFPSGTPAANGGPAWSNWALWTKMYQVYTVIRVHYKLTIHIPRSGSNNGMMIITNEESKTSGDGDENRSINDGNLYMYMGLENHKRHYVGPGTNDAGNEGAFKVIEGMYYPGKFKRNVVNDTDVKTWNKTDATPDLIDNLMIAFFHDPLRATGATATPQHANCQLEMKAVVQFKDLKEAFRYPANQLTEIDLTYPTDARHYTLGNAALFNSTV